MSPKTGSRTSTAANLFIKRAFMGVYHSMSAQYPPLYMSDCQSRGITRGMEPEERLVKILTLGGEGRRPPEPERIQRREEIDRRQAEERIELERKRRIHDDGQIELF